MNYIFNIISSYCDFSNNVLSILSKRYNIGIDKIISNEYFDVSCLYIFQKGIIISNIEIKSYDFLEFIQLNNNIKKIKLYVPFNKIIFNKFPNLETIEFFDNSCDTKLLDNDNNITRNISLKKVILEKDIIVEILGSFFKHVLFIEKLIFKKNTEDSSHYFDSQITIPYLESINIKEIFFYYFCKRDINYVMLLSKLCNINYINICKLDLYSTELSKKCFEEMNISNIFVDKFINYNHNIFIRNDQIFSTNDIQLHITKR